MMEISLTSKNRFNRQNPMKTLVVQSLLAAVLLGAPVFSAETPVAPKPAVTKPVAEVRKVTVKLTSSTGAALAEATVPGVVRSGEIFVRATLDLPGGKRRVIEVNAGGEGTIQDAQIRISVSDPDRPAIVDGNEKGLRVGGPLRLFDISTAYSGPGDYEVYRSQAEKMTVTIQ